MTTEPPTVFTTVVEVIKPGVRLDRLEETIGPAAGPPVVGSIYLHRYVTAALGEKLKITIEKAG